LDVLNLYLHRTGALALRAWHAHPIRVEQIAWTCLALLACEVAFYSLGDYGIVNGNEALYVESAREMLRSGNWIFPTLNDLPYLEKPPLFVWLIAAAIRIGDLFPVFSPEWFPRSVTAVATVGLVAMASRSSKRLGVGRTGIAAGFILVTTLGIDVMSRVAMPDMLLAVFFSMACFNMGSALATGSRTAMRAAAALIGVACMVKGPVTLALALLLGVAVAIFIPQWRSRARSLLLDPLLPALALAPIAGWLTVTAALQPDAAWRFIVDEQILRFLGLREPHDYYGGSVFYYIPRLFLFFFPWSGVLALGWYATCRGGRRTSDPVRTFLWLCVWVPFGFFSLSSAKANYYIVLCLPPMALLTAGYLSPLLEAQRRSLVPLAVSVPVFILFLMWCYRWWAKTTARTPPLLPEPDGSGSLTMLVVLAITVFIVMLVQYDWRRVALLCLGALVLPISMEFDHIVTRVEPLISARTLAETIKTQYPDIPVYLYQDYEAVGALPVYLGHTVPVIDSMSSDLAYGRVKDPLHPNFVRAAEVAARDSGLVVVRDDRLQVFRSSPLAKNVQMTVRAGSASVFRLGGRGG